jgi:hypothetical protein
MASMLTIAKFDELDPFCTAHGMTYSGGRDDVAAKDG